MPYSTNCRLVSEENNLQTRRTLLVGAAGLVLASSHPRSAVAADAVDEIREARRGLTSMRARFSQRRKTSMLTVESSGELAIVLPDRLRLDQNAPEDSTHWVTPKGTFSRAKGSAVAPLSKRDEWAVVLPHWLLLLAGDIALLKSDYELTSSMARDGSILVGMTPKGGPLGDLVSRFSMQTNLEKWGASRLEWERPNGSSRTFEFGANEKNPKIDPARMRPEP
jgi:outer membrane lipoprotein-sorting protein